MAGQKTIFIRYTEDGYSTVDTTIVTSDFELIELLASTTDATKLRGILKTYASSYQTVEPVFRPDLTVAPPLKNAALVKKMLEAAASREPGYA